MKKSWSNFPELFYKILRAIEWILRKIIGEKSERNISNSRETSGKGIQRTARRCPGGTIGRTLGAYCGRFFVEIVKN